MFWCDHQSNAMHVFCSDGKKTKLWLNQTRLENHENNLFPAKFRDWRPWENSTKNRPLSYYAKLLFSFVLHKRRERFSYMVRYFLKILFAQWWKKIEWRERKKKDENFVPLHNIFYLVFKVFIRSLILQVVGSHFFSWRTE